MTKLSVILTFDVADTGVRYCLDSLARQRLEDAEVILVPVEPQDDSGGAEIDDGHTADSAPSEDAGADESVASTEGNALTIAEEYAGATLAGLSVTLLERAAASHAQARLTGASRADGEYLAFVAGGDALPSYALGYLTASLDSSGSDFATGDVYRFNELGTRPSQSHRSAFREQRTATHARDHTSLLSDRLVGNKVWRHSFWERCVSAAETLWQRDRSSDLAVVRAHFLAGAVDVLPAPVYLLRDRESPDDLSALGPMSDRLRDIATLSAQLDGEDRRLWDATALRRDVRQVLLRLDDAEPATQRRFLELANAYLETVEPKVINDLSPMHRLNCYLIGHHDIDRLLQFLVFQKSVEPKQTPVVRRGLRYYLNYPFFDDASAGIPRSVYRLDSRFTVRQKTEYVEWRGDTLVLGGRVGIQHLRAGRRWQQHLLAFAVNAETGRRVPLQAHVRQAAEYRLPNDPNAARHDFGGFEVAIDPRKLRIGGQWQETAWRIELLVVNRGLVRRRIVANPVSGQPERPPYHEVADGVWVRPSWDADRRLRLTVEPLHARITAHGSHDTAEGRELELIGRRVTARAGEADVLSLTRRPGTARFDYPLRDAGEEFHVRVPLRDLLEAAINEGNGKLRQEHWQAELRTPDGTAIPLVLPETVETDAYRPDNGDLESDGHREVAVQRSRTGHLRLRAGWAHPVISHASWDGHTLVLAGRYTADSATELVLKAQGRQEEHPITMESEGREFRATFTPTAIETLSGPLSLSAGTYQVWARVRSGHGESTDIRAELDPDFVDRLPLSLETDQRSYTFADSGFDTPVLRVGSDLKPEERGRFAQRQLREVHYPQLREEPLWDGILFDSYTGRQYSDSPQRIYAELRARGGAWADYPMSWLVRDGQVNLPDDLTPVRYHGREYYETLARAAFLVTNSRQPTWFHRRPDQTVIQTWHGSMLKRIGFDIDNIRGKARDYHEKLAWETRQWDYLISPSPWATPILRRAFRFEGEILETGYPRNDIFFAPERHAIAERTRARLGIPADKKVILYAPTWRDDKYYTRGKHKLDLHLDLHTMYEKLGEEYVLLIRRHPRVVDSVPIVGENFVYDVSLYPEIMELFLITDVLVTDYSSMMFDFANTGRPMLFFTYDIESYRDQLRGFYFDFEETAPGPLLRHSDDVIASILDIDDVAASYADRYRAFVAQFCPLDDGNAAARVVDRVFATS